MTKQRTHNVQVPGAPADEQKTELTADHPTEVQAAAADAVIEDVGTGQEVGDDVEALKAQLAAMQAENAALKAAKPAKEEVPEAIAHPSKHYSHMHHTEVDKSKISAPVLCKDGWLVP